MALSQYKPTWTLLRPWSQNSAPILHTLEKKTETENTHRNFRRRLIKFLQYRRLAANLEGAFPEATEEELVSHLPFFLRKFTSPERIRRSLQ